jgi:hypothetical protein
VDWDRLKEVAMSNLPAVTDQTFDAEILTAAAALVDFWGHG